MEFRQLSVNDASDFVSLIVDMYGHLENLEWFSPMPFDEENVKSMIENPRFFILGVFDKSKLCAVSSFDYKCGKLFGKNVLPPYCTPENTVEIGFTMVRFDCQGQGIMKKMIAYLENVAVEQNFKYVFGKVHKDNNASFRSFLKCGFEKYCDFDKPVDRNEFSSFLSANILKKETAQKAQETLKRYDGDIIGKYSIYIKSLK